MVDRNGLENRRTARYRGFESLLLRSTSGESAYEKFISTFYFLELVVVQINVGMGIWIVAPFKISCFVEFISQI